MRQETANFAGADGKWIVRLMNVTVCRCHTRICTAHGFDHLGVGQGLQQHLDVGAAPGGAGHMDDQRMHRRMASVYDRPTPVVTAAARSLISVP